MAIMSGCSAPKSTGSDAPPDDFAVSITVYSPLDDPTLATGVRRPFRPGRYLVEADGSVRGVVAVDADEATYPAIARRVGPREIDRLWSLVLGAGLARSDHDGRIGSESAVTPVFDRTVAVVSVQHDGRRDTTMVPLDDGTADAQAALLLVDEVAALSYMRP